VKACSYMAVADPMALRREVFGGTGYEDDRSPAAILRAMLSRSRGVHQAHEVVRAGRRSKKLYEVGGKGARVFSSGGEPRELADALVRHTCNGEPTTDFPPAAGFTAASRHWADVWAKVEELTKAVETMAVVPVDEGGHSLVERDGWNDAQIAELRRRLDRSDRKPATWADTYDFNRQAAQEQADEDQAS
jgi:hypothetical protein